MRKLAFICGVILSLFFTTTALAQTGEQIRSFDVSVHIQPSSAIIVREKIVYDFGDQQKHGIFRTVPEKLKSVAVFDENNKPYTFKVSGQEIKIGDADKTITGIHTYIISYTIDRAIDYYKDFDELYWNVTGNDWLVPINSASVRVELSQPVAQNELRVSCYYGVKGSTQTCGTNPQTSSDKVYSVDANTTAALGAGEGITIAVGFPKGLVAQPTQAENIWQFILTYGILFLPIIVLVVMLRMWWKKGRDPKGRGTIVAEYDAPDNLTPLELSAVLNQGIKSSDISAEIVHLATKGFLTITKTQEKGLIFKHDEYILTKTSDKIPEAEFDQKIITGLFGEKKEVKLSDLKMVFYKEASGIRKYVIASVVSKGYFPVSPDTTRLKYVSYGAAFFVLIFLVAITKLLNGFAVVGLLFSGFIVILFANAMPKVTAEGALLRDKIKGLKLYMNVAEKDRINFHNAPEKNPALFEHLLAYAMVLGIEEKWAKQFESIYMTPPSWYHDSNVAGFNSVMFAHNMSAFNSVAATTIATSPGGSGGGGSSGGGGGGGGGGSW